MGFIARLLGTQGKGEDPERGMSRLQVASQEQTRRELIAMALRDTLKRHGLAPGCIAAEGVPSVAPGRQRGMHVQLVFRDWQPSLLAYVVALEAAVRGRLERLDPLSPSWIAGVSWRFEPTDRTQWPQLPTAVPGQAAARPRAHRDASPRHGTTAALHRLLQAGDGAFGTDGRPDFSATQPMFSPTQPMARP